MRLKKEEWKLAFQKVPLACGTVLTREESYQAVII